MTTTSIKIASDYYELGSTVPDVVQVSDIFDPCIVSAVQIRRVIITPPLHKLQGVKPYEVSPEQYQVGYTSTQKCIIDKVSLQVSGDLVRSYLAQHEVSRARVEVELVYTAVIALQQELLQHPAFTIVPRLGVRYHSMLWTIPATQNAAALAYQGFTDNPSWEDFQIVGVQGSLDPKYMTFESFHANLVVNDLPVSDISSVFRIEVSDSGVYMIATDVTQFEKLMHAAALYDKVQVEFILVVRGF